MFPVPFPALCGAEVLGAPEASPRSKTSAGITHADIVAFATWPVESQTLLASILGAAEHWISKHRGHCVGRVGRNCQLLEPCSSENDSGERRRQSRLLPCDMWDYPYDVIWS